MKQAVGREGKNRGQPRLQHYIITSKAGCIIAAIFLDSLFVCKVVPSVLPAGLLPSVHAGMSRRRWDVLNQVSYLVMSSNAELNTNAKNANSGKLRFSTMFYLVS